MNISENEESRSVKHCRREENQSDDIHIVYLQLRHVQQRAAQGFQEGYDGVLDSTGGLSEGIRRV